MQCHKLCVLITIIFMGRSSSALNCSDDKPFDCGNVGYITYPFWGGDRPSECGRKGFELICNNNIPTLTISSLSYLVQKLDFSTNTLTVARQDLHDTTCPDPPLHNTTVDWKLFKQPSAATDRNITLFFDCTGSSSDDPNAFACSSNNRSNNNLFTVGGGKRSCSSNIYVPINNNDAESLENPTPSSINILRSALATGFSIQWFNDSKQFSAPFCNPNVYLSCRALDPTRPVCDKEKYSECYTYRSSANDGAPNSPPAPAPAPAPDGYPPRTHKETPTTAHPPQTHYTSQFDNTGAKRTKKIVIVVVSVSLSVAGIVAVSISLHCFLKRRRHSICGPDPTPLCKHDVEKLLLQQGSRTPKRYKYSQLKKITASFRDKLGQGGFGSVYKGMLSDGRPVAVKILIEAANSNGEEFLNEIVSISRTSHVNIVTLLGFCYEGNKRALVYEYMPNNSLDKFLKSNRSAGSMDSCCLDIEKLYKIALGIAKGLEYLHTGCITRIVHFDIKPQNILLDEDLCPKISDFGLAKLCKKKQSIMSVLGTRGTVGYIAPEVFSRNFGGVSHKSDVYSYGMMLLEMAGATKLPEADEVQSNENYFPDIIYEQVIRDVANKEPDDLMMEEDEETTTRKMILVGFWCIQTIPSNRPSISKVVEMIEGRVESIQIPPKPLLSSPPHLPSSTHQISSSLTPSVLTQDSVQF